MDAPTENGLKGVKVLITGGFGYIGKHVALLLLQNGATVEIWDIRNPFKKTNVLIPDWKVDGRLEWWTGDNLSYNLVDIYENTAQIDHYRKNHKFDVIINLAALADVPSCEANPDRAHCVNVRAARAMMLLAADWKALFLHADSAMSPYFHTSPSAYVTTKALAKESVAQAREALALKASCLTLYNVAGAHEFGKVGEDHIPETHFIPNVVLAALKGENVMIDSKAHMIFRDFVHVWDVAHAFMKAIKRHMGGTLLNKDYEVGRGEEVSLHHVTKLAWDMGMVFKTDSYESGRWEPYEHGFSMKSNPANWVHGWFPTKSVYTMLWDQRNFMEQRLPKPGV